MALEFNWFLPTDGDGRDLIHTSASPDIKAHASGNRAPTVEYLGQIARAAEYAGFHAALLPTGSNCEDPWLMASAVAAETKTLKFLVAFRLGFELPAYAAQKAATFQSLSNGRLLLNVVTGSSSAEQKSYGDFLDHESRYERTAEFLRVVKGVWKGRPFDHDGPHYEVKGGGLVHPLTPSPRIYFGGASPPAERVAAALSDVYLLWGETPAMVKDRVRRVSQLAQKLGRTLRFGLRLHIIGRETEREAWAEAERLLKGLPDEAITKAQTLLKASESVGQARMLSLHGGLRGKDVRDLEVYPNLWAGIGLVRSGAGTALVGSYRNVAERLQEYASIGIDTFILSGYPNWEEALRVGEEVLPLVAPAASVSEAAALTL
jgi:alkanesulfonate monooxygenase